MAVFCRACGQQVETHTQMGRVIAKFGGAAALARALCLVDKNSTPKAVSRRVYRWKLREHIPLHAIPMVTEAARLDGVLLTPEDIDPRPR
jgi:hypothetical protein